MDYRIACLVVMLVTGLLSAAELPLAVPIAKWALPDGAGNVHVLEWMPDGKAVVSGESSGGVRIWDAATGRVKVSLDSQSPVSVLAVHPDNVTVCIGCGEDGLTIWNSQTNQTQTIAASDLFAQPKAKDRMGPSVASIAWKSETGTFAVCSDHEILVHVSPDGKQTGEAVVMPEMFGKGERAYIRDHAAVAPAAGLGLAYYEGFEVDELRLWDFKSKSVIRQATLKELARPTTLAMSPCGQRSIVRDLRRSGLVQLLIFDVRTLTEIGVVSLEGTKNESPLLARFSHDGRWLLATPFGKPTIICDVARLAPVAKVAAGLKPCLSIAPDGRRIIACPNPSELVLLDLKSTIDPNPPVTVDLAACWSELTSPDAAVALRAAYRMAAHSDCVAFIGGKLKPVAKPVAADVTKWLADLSSPAFAARQTAVKKLTAIADQIRDELAQELKNNPSPEAAEAIRTIQDSSDRARRKLEGETLRSYRAIQVLEMAGPQAKKLLNEYASGAKTAFLTEESVRARDRSR